MITKFKIFEKNSDSFTIPEKMQEYYKIVGDISNVSEWKAKIILNNNNGRNLKIGNYDDVGYIMINYNNSNIIPIARSDEHQRGEELLYHLYSKKLISDINYTPIFYGNNYFHYDGVNDKQIQKDLISVKKYLEYGGKNTNLTINWKYKLDLNTFIKLDGDINNIEKYINDKGQLTDDAEYFISYLEKIAWLLRKRQELIFNSVVVSSAAENISKKEIMKNAEYLIEYINNIDFMDTHKFNKAINKAIIMFDVNLLADILFYHNGLKNEIHMLLKKKDPKLKKFFGNLDLALSKFDNLSAI